MHGIQDLLFEHFILSRRVTAPRHGVDGHILKDVGSETMMDNLERIAGGLGNKVIGGELNIAEGTVGSRQTHPAQTRPALASGGGGSGG